MIRLAILVLALLSVAAVSLDDNTRVAPPKKDPTVDVQDASCWSFGVTQVVLYPTPDWNYRLIVINPKDYVVMYRTAIVTHKKVAEVLEPVKGSTNNFKVYEISHHFSRRTPWMAVEFLKDGKRVEELTRTFFDGITNPVENGEYLDEEGRGGPELIQKKPMIGVAVDHSRWVEGCLKDFESLKPGMTRKEVDEKLEQDGGIQFVGKMRYQHPDCPYFKVDIEFACSRDAEGRIMSKPTDKVTAISNPYLEWPVMD